MRARALALAGAFVLAGCAGGERVTLLPAAQERGVGAVAVLDTEAGETVLDAANSQAILGSRSPRVRQLKSVDPAYAELINSFPRLIEPQAIRFQTAGTRISAEQIDNLKALLQSLGSDLSIYQIEIAGYTDSVGKEQDNLRLSQNRARQVAELLRSEGFEIDDNDIIGRGEYAAVRELGDEKESAQYRAVTIKIR
ncbi:MAG: OmpA family protein [Pseudomonadota bacterium]